MRKFFFVILIFLTPAISMAQGYGSGRAQTWDFTFGALYQQADVATGNGGSSLEVDDAWGLGFNIGYNFSNRLSISADFDFLSPDYTAVVITEPNPPDGSQQTTRIDHELSQFNGRLKGTYYFMEGPFAPFIEAGIGWSFIDSNVASGPPQGFCWWHPWWGYICESFVDTFSSTEFSYGGALGMRYELAGNTFIKASYNVWALDTGSSRADPELETFRVEYGWQF
jgi:opacity protein-like surface antigen